MGGSCNEIDLYVWSCSDFGLYYSVYGQSHAVNVSYGDWSYSEIDLLYGLFFCEQ